MAVEATGVLSWSGFFNSAFEMREPHSAYWVNPYEIAHQVGLLRSAFRELHNSFWPMISSGLNQDRLTLDREI